MNKKIKLKWPENREGIEKNLNDAYYRAGLAILEELKSQLEQSMSAAGELEENPLIKIIDDSIDKLNKTKESKAQTFTGGSRLWSNTSRIGATKFADTSKDSKNHYEIVKDCLKEFGKSLSQNKSLSKVNYAEAKDLLNESKKAHAENRKQAKRYFWYTVKSLQAEALSTLLNNYVENNKLSSGQEQEQEQKQKRKGKRKGKHEQELIIIQKELNELKKLKGHFDYPIDASQYQQEQKLKKAFNNGEITKLEGGYQALEYHRRAIIVAARIKKLTAGEATIDEVNQQFVEGTKRYLDAYYKHGHAHFYDKIRLGIKIFCWGSAAALGIATLVLLFTPAAPAAIVTGLATAGMIGIAPLIDTIAATIINAIYFKRNPVASQVVEIGVASAFVPLFAGGGHILSAIGHGIMHTARSVGTVLLKGAIGFSSYGVTSFGTALNTLATLWGGGFLAKRALIAKNPRFAQSYQNAMAALAAPAGVEGKMVAKLRYKAFAKNAPAEAYVYLEKEIVDAHQIAYKTKKSQFSKIATWNGFSFWEKVSYSVEIKKLLTALKRLSKLPAELRIDIRISALRTVRNAAKELPKNLKDSSNIKQLTDMIEKEIKKLKKIKELETFKDFKENPIVYSMKF